jgi:hypothetical protein
MQCDGNDEKKQRQEEKSIEILAGENFLKQDPA